MFFVLGCCFCHLSCVCGCAGCCVRPPVWLLRATNKPSVPASWLAACFLYRSKADEDPLVGVFFRDRGVRLGWRGLSKSNLVREILCWNGLWARRLDAPWGVGWHVYPECPFSAVACVVSVEMGRWCPCPKAKLVVWMYMNGGLTGDFSSVSRATCGWSINLDVVFYGKAVPKYRTASPPCFSLPCVTADEISKSPRFVPPARLRS